MFTFADSFDMYATLNDMGAGYWDSAAGGSVSLAAGRFTGQCLQFNAGGGWNATKASNVNDAVHHFVLAFRQSSALTGNASGINIQLFDSATAQCTLNFRSDGALLLQSGSLGATLATYAGAVNATNVWIAFEIEVVIHNTAGSFTVRKNGNTSNDFTVGSLNTRGGTTNNYANKILMNNPAAISSQLLDDLLWRSDPTSVAWMGDIRSYVRMPASDASVQFARSLASVSVSQTAAGGFTASRSANAGSMSAFAPSYSGTIASGTIQVALGATVNVKVAIYDATRATVLATANVIVNPTTGANVVTFPTPFTVTKGTIYYLATDQDAPLQYNLTGTTTEYTFTTAYASFPAASPVLTPTQQGPTYTLTISPTTNANFVSETLQDGTTSYVYDATVGHADFYSIAAASSALTSVVAVTTRGFIEKSDAGARSGAVQLRSGTGGDPNISNVTLLCHFNGTSGSTAFVDSSGSAHTLTATNGANLSSTQTKFGTASGNFAAGTTTYAAVGGSLSDFEFGSAPFTIEAWVYATTTPAVSSILSRFNNLTTDAFFFGTIFDIGFYYVDGTGTVQAWTAPGFTVSTGVWHHIAVDRDATNTTRLYRDGVVIATQSIPTIHSSSQLCYIGNDQGLARNWPGYIDDLRVTKGAARYAGAFTPPTLTFPDTGVSTVQSTSTPLTSSFAWLYRTDSTDPNTGSTWTPAAVDGLQIGPVVTA